MELKYFGTAVMNQKFTQEEIKRRKNSGNSGCTSGQTFLSSRLLPKILKD
jgi:hypothetical protein